MLPPPPTRIRIPTPGAKPAKSAETPKPRDELARVVTSMVELGAFVRKLRMGLHIHQAELATRAKVGRQWIVELDQGKPRLEGAKILRTLATLGFELVLSPYDPPPPWMLRAVAEAEAPAKVRDAGRRTRRNGRRAKARMVKVAENEVWVREDVE